MTYTGKPRNKEEEIIWDGTKFITASIIVSGSEFNEWIDGGSRLVSTSSVSVDSTSTYANQIGSDVFFYVSGTKGSTGTKKAVFGGDVVISGTLTASNQIYVGTNVVWNAGNDGAGSGLDADLLDGKSTITSAQYWNGVPLVASDGVMEIGRYIDFHNASVASDYDVRLDTQSSSTDLYISGRTAPLGPNKIWHQGNDGSGSGLDADLLDAIDSTGFVQTGSLSQTKAGNMTFSAGLTGSIQQTAGGVAYIVGGTNITTATASNGQITISINTTGLNADTLDTIDSLGFIQTGTLAQTKASTLTISQSSVPLSTADFVALNLATSINLHSKLTAGAWNPLTQVNDSGIIFRTGSMGTGGLIIAPWTSLNYAFRMSGSGATALDTATFALNANGTNILTASNRSVVFPLGLSGSLQQTSAGNPYIIAGANITVATNSLGQIEITGSSGTAVTSTWIEGTPSPRIRTSASVAIGSGTGFAQDFGTNVFFYVSGAKNSTGSTTSGYSVFGGDVVISGAAAIGTTHVITGSASSFVGGGVTNTISASSQNAIIAGNLNTINATSTNSTILGGVSNVVSSSLQSAVVGGSTNEISRTSTNSVIVGGSINMISTSLNSSILAGSENDISGSSHAAIIGGNYNIISTSLGSVIITGVTNSIAINSRYSVIGASSNTNVRNFSTNSLALGTSASIVDTSSFAGVIGGLSNNIFRASRAGILFSGNSTIISSSTAVSTSANNNVIIGSSGSAISQSIDGMNGIYSANNSYISGSERSIILSGDTNSIINSASLAYMIGGSSNQISKATWNNGILGGFLTSIINTDGGNTFTGGSYINQIIGGYNSQIQNNITDGDATGKSFAFINVIGGGNNIFANNGVNISGFTIIGANSIVANLSSARPLTKDAFRNVAIGGSSNVYGPEGFSDCATIAGAGNILAGYNSETVLIGGYLNYATSDYVTPNLRNVIVGGTANKLDSANYGTIIGGNSNALTGSDYSVLIAGANNVVSGGALYSTVLGGGNSSINGGTNSSLLVASSSFIRSASGSVILAGNNHSITSVTNSIIIGGTNNRLSIGADNNILLGGSLSSSIANNILIGGSNYSTIVSGGLTGSIQRTTAGKAYIAAGPGITIVTNSNQQVEVSSSTVPLLSAFRSYGTLTQFSLWSDMINTVQGLAPFTATAQNGGASQLGSAIAGRFGISRQSTGATASGSVTYTAAATSVVFGSGIVRFRTDVILSNTSSATDTFAVRLGFNDSAAATPGDAVDGVYFRYTNAVNAGKWQCVARSNSVESALDSTISASATTASMQSFEIQVDATGATASFYINGSNVANVTASIPTGIARATGINCHISKSVGTTARTIDYDCLGMIFIPTTAL